MAGAKEATDGSFVRAVTLTRVLEDGIDLVAGNPRKPRQEIRDQCAAFEILEERAHRNAERSRHHWRFSKVSTRFARA